MNGDDWQEAAEMETWAEQIGLWWPFYVMVVVA
jgi:hypothetical protein